MGKGRDEKRRHDGLLLLQGNPSFKARFCLVLEQKNMCGACKVPCGGYIHAAIRFSKSFESKYVPRNGAKGPEDREGGIVRRPS